MAKYRMVRTDFWKNPIVSEEMTPEDKYFYLYLLTNPATTQIGIYKITKKQIAFDMGYSIESVHSLVERFIQYHKMIQYNSETRELAIKNWGKYNLQKGGKPVMDCIESELKEVEDSTLIQYVSETIEKKEIRVLFDSFCEQSKWNESTNLAEADTYFETTSKNLEMSDIRESGSVEQDADVIMFLYREAYYNKETDNHSLEIIVLKNRNGPVGIVTVNYYEKLGRIKDKIELSLPQEEI